MDDVLRDIIEVKNLRVSAFLGVNEGERVTKQRLVITLSLSTDLRSTASQDSLATTFNYSHVTKVVTTFVERSAYFTLEALTEAIARVLIVELGVPRANVRVEKPEALAKKNVDCAACEVTRTPADFIIAAPQIQQDENSNPSIYAAAIRYAVLSLAPAPPPVLLSVSPKELQHEVYLGLGSNVGNRPANIEKALTALVDEEYCVLLHTSLMYETPAAYMTDQPAFLNCAVKVRTHLSPHALLARLKHVESSLGRDIKGGVRFGPRPIDIDILLFGPDVVLDDSFCKDTSGEPDVHSANHSSEATGGWLTLPHPRLEERIFVLAPLCDIAPGLRHPINGRTMAELLGALGTHPLLSDGSSELPNALPGDIDGYTQLCPVLPFASSIGGQVLRYCEGTSLMGVVNATPDSFSDGGQFDSSEAAVAHACSLLAQGATIVDVGGESTRPGAMPVTLDEELKRVVPVIEGIKREYPSGLISIDTYKAEVARAAVAAGANMVNDISGGTLDHAMLATVAELNVPYVISHMVLGLSLCKHLLFISHNDLFFISMACSILIRFTTSPFLEIAGLYVGDPRTMGSTQYLHTATPSAPGISPYVGSGVVGAVANFWATKFGKALEAGVRRWNIVLDPGLGFAKNGQHNLEILQQLRRLKRVPGTCGFLFAPLILVGASRKGFIKTGLAAADSRAPFDAATTNSSVNSTTTRLDLGTAGTCAVAVMHGAGMLRVHSVENVRDAVTMADSIKHFKVP